MGRSQVNATLQTLHQLATEHGVVLIEKAAGHFQIRGALLVNYYPFSKAQTAYVDGTKGGRHKVSPYDAVQMAKTAPPVVAPPARDRRKGWESRERRQWLMDKRGVRNCRWCDCPLDIDTATLEHVIPLSRGGLDQATNWTLACYPCNQDRGGDMPELEFRVSQPLATTLVDPDRPLRERRDAIVTQLDTLNVKLTLTRRPKSKGLALANYLTWSAEAICEIRLLKSQLRLANEAVAEADTQAYHAAFRTVAKEVLPQSLYEQINQETQRRQAAIASGDATHDVRSKSAGTQHQPDGNRAVHLAAALLASSTRRSTDTPRQEPQR